MSDYRFATQIYKARTKAKLSQTKLSELTGIRRESINRYENGIVIPRIDKFVACMQACGYDIEIIKGGNNG